METILKKGMLFCMLIQSITLYSKHHNPFTTGCYESKGTPEHSPSQHLTVNPFYQKPSQILADVVSVVKDFFEHEKAIGIQPPSVTTELGSIRWRTGGDSAPLRTTYVHGHSPYLPDRCGIRWYPKTPGLYHLENFSPSKDEAAIVEEIAMALFAIASGEIRYTHELEYSRPFWFICDPLRVAGVSTALTMATAFITYLYAMKFISAGFAFAGAALVALLVLVACRFVGERVSSYVASLRPPIAEAERLERFKKWFAANLAEQRALLEQQSPTRG